MSQNNSSVEKVKCDCLREAVVTTSWKEDNVGRRFLGCENYPNDGYCTFFRWIEPPLCERSRNIIHGLLRRCNHLRAECNEVRLECHELRQRNDNLQIMTAKLEEMSNLMQGVTRRLEEENQKLQLRNAELKRENLALKKTNKFKRTWHVFVKICICSFVCCLLVSLLLDNGSIKVKIIE